MTYRSAAAWAIMACACHAWAYRQAAPAGRSHFVLPQESSPAASGEPSVARRTFASPDWISGIVHAACLCELSDGSLVAVWYAGSAEAARDVAIQLAMRAPGDHTSWSPPRVVVDAASASQELNRPVTHLGNALVFADHQDRLWLIYVGTAIGGWSTSALNLTLSTDRGATWTRSRRLRLNPFFNLGELVRHRPLWLSDEGIAVPIYHELFGEFPEILWLSTAADGVGVRWRKSRIAGGRSFIQPTLVPSSADAAMAFLRDRSGERAVALALTSDGGTTWSVPRRLSLPNPDAALDALRLTDGTLLLAFNDSATGRHNLRLAASRDGGRSWVRIATLENTGGEEFSYPYLLRARDARVHLLYTWRRRRIAHAVFTERWLWDRLAEAS